MVGRTKYGRQSKICSVLRREKVSLSNTKEIFHVHTTTSIPLYVHFLRGLWFCTWCMMHFLLYPWNLEDVICIKPAAFFILLLPLLPQFPERSCRYGLQHWQLIDKTPQQEAIFDEITFKQTLDIDTKSSLCCIPCVACMFQ